MSAQVAVEALMAVEVMTTVIVMSKTEAATVGNATAAPVVEAIKVTEEVQPPQFFFSS